MTTQEEQTETLDLINTELAGRLERQSAAGSRIDTKAALVAGVAAAGVQFLASRSPAPDSVLAAAAYAAYAVAFATAVLAYALARYRDVPDPRGLVRGCAHLTKGQALAQLIATRTDVFEKNVRKHRKKVVLWWVSVSALGAAVAVSAAAIAHTGGMPNNPASSEPASTSESAMPTGDEFIDAYYNPSLVSSETRNDSSTNETGTKGTD